MPVGAGPVDVVTVTFVSEPTLLPPKTMVAREPELEMVPPVVGEMTVGGGESPLPVFVVGSGGVPSVPFGGVVLLPPVGSVVVPPTTTLIVPVPVVLPVAPVVVPALVSPGGVVVAVVRGPPPRAGGGAGG